MKYSYSQRIKNLFKRQKKESLDIYKGLYDYQLEAVTATNENDRGIVCMPTSTGKTYTMATMIATDIINNPNQFRTYVINAPRIMLSYQLLNEVYGFLTMAGIEARYMFVHSGRVSDEEDREKIRRSANHSGHSIPYSEIGSATSSLEITKMMAKAQQQKLPLIFVSTYHSAERIEPARRDFAQVPLSMIVNDEAHYLVQEQFHDILNTLESDKCFFFTATRIHTPSDKGRGMNNVEAYGEILYEMTPREAIERGKMVRPRLHIVRTKNVYNTDDYDRSLTKIIKDSFEQHEAVIEQKPKLLVSVKGTGNMQRFLTSAEYRTLRNNHVHIYAVASNEEVGNDINGEKVRRSEFLRRLKEDGSNPTKKILVLHYDILAEGIDVSGFTGIMPLRSLKKSKFMQTYGRAARLDKEDRRRIDAGEITPNDLNKMNKPYAYVIIPDIVHSNHDDKTYFTDIINELRHYDFKPYENIVASTMINGIPEIEELEGLNDITRRVPNYGVLVENLEADVEAESDASLEHVDWVKKHLGL
jgi:superfamily II DNA or RNA helicase